MQLTKLIIYLLVISMPFSIKLFSGITGGYHITTDEILIITSLVLLFFELGVGTKTFTLNTFEFSLITFTIIVYISILINESRLAPILQFTKVWTEYIVLYFIIKTIGHNDYKFNKNLLILVTIVGTLICFVSLSPKFANTIRLEATFLDPNTFGRYIIIISCLVLSYGLYYNKIIPTIILLLFFILIMFKTQSRTGLIALLLSITIIFSIHKKKWIVALLLIFPFIYTYIVPQEYIQRIETIFNIFGQQQESPISLQNRLYVIGEALNNINIMTFLFGSKFHFRVYDNQFLSIFIRYGIFALLTFCYLLYKIIIIIKNSFFFSKTKISHFLATAFVGIMLMMLVQSLFFRTFFSPRTGGIFWLLFAVLTNLIISDAKSSSHIVHKL